MDTISAILIFGGFILLVVSMSFLMADIEELQGEIIRIANGERKK